jgi:hypothetical protein
MVRAMVLDASSIFAFIMTRVLVRSTLHVPGVIGTILKCVVDGRGTIDRAVEMACCTTTRPRDWPRTGAKASTKTRTKGDLLNLATVRTVAPVALSLLGLAACGGAKNPSAPTPTSVPSAVPTATPTSAASSDPRISKSCAKLKAGSATAQCKKDVPTFQAEVDAAIRLLESQQPEIFDGNKVLSSPQYIVGLINNLDAVGICAYWDGEELAVKNEDWFSDQYAVITSSYIIRNGTNSYAATCYPAAFPLSLPGLPGQVAGCSLPPSSQILCGKDPQSKYIDLVDTAIGNALVQHPECFDPKDTPPASNYAKILNMQGYLNAVAQELQSKGLCTFYDGEEIQVKGGNDHSEHFDMVLGNTHIRRGAGMYASSCYPAAF